MQNQQSQTKTITWISYKTSDIVWTVGLTLASIIAPLLLAHTPQNQWITGTLVNALLFVGAWRLGIANSIAIAALPSSIALVRGLLPLPMAILIPFIIFSNLLLVSLFGLLKNKIYFATLAASLAKFTFLLAVSGLLAEKIGSRLVLMMSWPQLVTALAGGILAIGIIKIFNRSVVQQSKVLS